MRTAGALLLSRLPAAWLLLSLLSSSLLLCVTAKRAAFYVEVSEARCEDVPFPLGQPCTTIDTIAVCELAGDYLTTESYKVTADVLQVRNTRTRQSLPIGAGWCC